MRIFGFITLLGLSIIGHSAFGQSDGIDSSCHASKELTYKRFQTHRAVVVNTSKTPCLMVMGLNTVNTLLVWTAPKAEGGEIITEGSVRGKNELYLDISALAPGKYHLTYVGCHHGGWTSLRVK